MRSFFVGFGASLALAAICGCTTIQLDFQQLPPAEAVDSVQPGVTTRSEVLQRLGPPEELRRPAVFERARLASPQHRQVIEAGRIFDRDAYTYASGRRTTRTLAILPARLTFFSLSRVRWAEARWRIEFDEADVVSSVSHVDERR